MSAWRDLTDAEWEALRGGMSREYQRDEIEIRQVELSERYLCPKCVEAGGEMRMWQDSCRECGGADPYGDSVMCPHNFCCGC